MLLLLIPTHGLVWTQGVSSAIKKATGKQTKQPASPAAADSSATAAPTPTPPPPPEDPLGRTSPRGCVLGFLRAAEAKDYAKAAEYLDGRRPQQQAEQLALQLKYLLDLRLSTNIDAISRSPKGDLEDQVRVSRERIGVVKTPNGDLEIFLDLVKRPGVPPIWLFSQETLNRVPGIYSGLQHKDYASYFPEWMARVRFLSVPLWRWTLILLTTLALLVVASLLTRIILWLLKVVFRTRLTPRVKEMVLALKGPILGLMLALLLRAVGGYAITALARHFWEMAGLLVAWISGGWLLIRLTDIVVLFVRHRLLVRLQVERATFVGLVGRLFKILVGIVLVVGLLSVAGVDVSALLAGLGIGGIALALAAQRTLADLFGGLSVVMRGAVRVGDFCQVDGVQGTAEDVGISSLQLRTLDRSLVSIPNAKVAEGKLENYSMRDQFWVHQVFTLRFDTPHTTVKTVLDRTVQLLASEPEIDKESARARLIGLTPSGPQIEVFAYFRRPGADWAMFLGVQEKIILKMMGIVESEGTSFAAPIGVVQMSEAKPVDSAGRDV
ncbi:mechanosensitive ion channel family protein [Edaphobacter aggregans]|uniref:mechanosensitive ion channel family protein n=1 Tax=Edaphobacter aggregans TaxID=570835 RepID=UPI001FE15E2E|nr:mechanosensitive ion channel family protein [Edaphobacter aggregans]